MIVYLTYRRLFHLHLANNATCGPCRKELIFYEQFEAQAPRERQLWMLGNGAFVVQDLISITERVLNHPTDDASHVSHILDHAILFIKADKYAGKSFRPLKNHLRSARPTYPPATRWCEALNKAIGNAPARSGGREAAQLLSRRMSWVHRQSMQLP
jgi:hypothetical protein